MAYQYYKMSPITEEEYEDAVGGILQPGFISAVDPVGECYYIAVEEDEESVEVYL